MQYYCGLEILTQENLPNGMINLSTEAGGYILYPEELTNRDHSPEAWFPVPAPTITEVGAAE